MTLSHYFLDQIRQQMDIVVQEDFPERMIMKPQGGGLLPIDTSLNADQSEFEYKIIRGQGIAEILSTGADDIPMVSLYADKKFGRIYDIANGYEFTDRELSLAQRTGQSLDSLYLVQARQGHDVKLEEVFYNGDALHGLTGFLNFPGVTVETLLPDGAGGSTTFASKTPEQKYRDLTQMVRRLAERTKNTYYIETLLLPTEIFNDLNDTLLPNNASGGITILSTFLRNQMNNPLGVKAVIPVPYLSGRGTGGTGFGVGYTRRADRIRAILPEYFEVQANPAPQNYKYRVNTRSACGGTVVYKPLAMVYFDGI